MSDVILTKYECDLQDTQEVQLLVTETTPRIFCIQEKKTKQKPLNFKLYSILNLLLPLPPVNELFLTFPYCIVDTADKPVTVCTFLL